MHAFGGPEHIRKCKCGASEAEHSDHLPQKGLSIAVKCKGFERADTRTPLQIAEYEYEMLVGGLKGEAAFAQKTIDRASARLADLAHKEIVVARFLKTLEGRS